MLTRSLNLERLPQRRSNRNFPLHLLVSRASHSAPRRADDQVRRQVWPQGIVLRRLRLAHRGEFLLVLFLDATDLAQGVILLNTAKSPPVWAIAKLCNGAGIGVLQ